MGTDVHADQLKRIGQVELFRKLEPVHLAACSLGGIASFVLAPVNWFESIIVATYFLVLLVSRLAMRGYADQERAILVFGRIFISMTTLCCVTFVIATNYFQLGLNVSDTGLIIFTINTVSVPMYMHLLGIFEEHRLLNTAIIGMAYSLAPGWTQRAHHEVSIIMWLALLAGETAGTYAASWMISASLSENWATADAAPNVSAPAMFVDEARRDGAHMRANSLMSNVRAIAPHQDIKCFVDTKSKPMRLPVDSPLTPSLQQSQSLVPAGKRSVWSGHLAHMRSLCFEDMLQWFFLHADCDCRAVRMQPVSLVFEDVRVELLFTVSSFPQLNAAHSYACCAAILACVFAVHSAPTTWCMAAIVGIYSVMLWLLRKRVAHYADVSRASQEFDSGYRSLSLFAGCAYCINLTLNPEPPSWWHPWLEQVNHVTNLFTRCATLESHLGYPSSGLIASSLLLILCGIHQRYVLLAPRSRMLVRCVIFGCVAFNHIHIPGEVLGYSSTLTRRSLFLFWLADAQNSARTAAKTFARLAAVEENAIELQRRNEAREAEAAADKRLAHVIKGRCGSAINSILTFRSLLHACLSEPLPTQMMEMLDAPVVHLAEAVAWCHRRQVFVQLEKGQYTSRATPVDVNDLLVRSLVGSGRLQSSIRERLKLDVTVLKLTLDEVISNALKYRRASTDVLIEADLVDTNLVVCITNVNAHGFVPLSPDEAKRVFEAGYKSHMASAASDGVGLDSVARAVAAARGTVFLTCDSVRETTSIRLMLPAEELPRTASASADHDVAGCVVAGGFAPSHYHEHESTSPLSTSLSNQARPAASSSNDSTSTSHSRLDLAAQHQGAPRTYCDRYIEGTLNLTGAQLSTACVHEVHSSDTKESSVAEKLPQHLDTIQQLPALLQENTPSTCQAVMDVPADTKLQSLRCVGIDDEDLPRFVQKILITMYLDGDESSCSLGGTAAEREAFVDVVMGVRGPDLALVDGPPVQADIALLDENIDECADPPLMGSSIAAELRMLGFRGIIVLLTASPTSQITELQQMPQIDLAFDKSSGLPVIAAAIKKLFAQRSGVHEAASI